MTRYTQCGRSIEYLFVQKETIDMCYNWMSLKNMLNERCQTQNLHIV